MPDDDADEPTRALVPLARGELDDYQRKYMAEGGLVLAQDKQPLPRWLTATQLALFAGLGVASVAAGSLGGLLGVGLAAPLMLLLSVLRVTVTQQHVNIQYGLFGPKIPITAIEEVEVRNYRPLKFGGWGIKRSLDGEWIYNAPGDGNRAIRIRWRSGRGQSRVTWVGSANAAQLYDAIQRARGQRALGPNEGPSEGPGE